MNFILLERSAASSTLRVKLRPYNRIQYIGWPLGFSGICNCKT